MLLDHLRRAWPPADWTDVTVVVAVSGGADSVSLLCALSELRERDAPNSAGRLIAAHFNHRLRDAAEDDERFVKELAGRLNLHCEVGYAAPPKGGTPTVGVPALAGPDGLEAAAREARYAFLLATAERLGARYVATAHTADDQSETILHRILRGTGLAGLAGIPRARSLSPAVTLIRPILEVSRACVVQYLADRAQNYRLDESNEDPAYTRNRIRHALLPQLAAQYNPNVREALLRLGQLAGEAQAVIEIQAQGLVAWAMRIVSPNEVSVDCARLETTPTHLVREAFIQLWKQQRWPLQQMGLDEWDKLASLINEAGTITLPGPIRASKQAGQLKLTRL